LLTLNGGVPIVAPIRGTAPPLPAAQGNSEFPMTRQPAKKAKSKAAPARAQSRGGKGKK
jgi:hypothetical protein